MDVELILSFLLNPLVVYLTHSEGFTFKILVFDGKLLENSYTLFL